MKYVIITLLLVYTLPLLSQSIIWESEFDLKEPNISGLYPMIIDSDSNIVLLLNQSVNPQVNPFFLKFNQKGKMITQKRLFYGYLLMPHSFYETETGYRILMGTDDRYGFGFADPYANTFPMIFNVNFSGDTIDTHIPYDYKIDSIKNDYSFALWQMGSNTINSNSKFYNVSTIQKNVPHPTIPNFSINIKLIIYNCYNDKGELIFRTSLDSTYSSASYYEGISMKKYNNNNFYALVHRNIQTMNGFMSNHIIFDLDTFGNLNKKLELKYDHFVFPEIITKLTNGEYIILSDSTLIKISSDGQILKQVEIKSNHIFDAFKFMEQVPDGGLLLSGRTRVTKEDISDSSKYKLNILKLDKDLEKEFDFEWYEHVNFNTSSINNIMFLDNETIIATGPKDRYKFWIAKINLNPVSVENVENVNKENILFPNPASNQIKLNFEADRIPNKYHTVNSLGIIQNEADISSSQLTLDISAYPAGLYFAVFEYADGTRHVEKFIKLGE